jgi:hypothetical protein
MPPRRREWRRCRIVPLTVGRCGPRLRGSELLGSWPRPYELHAAHWISIDRPTS